MNDMQAIARAVRDLEQHIASTERRFLAADGYMPSLATHLRLIADEMADKYPDDTNGGREMTHTATARGAAE
jgi:hypothetical protein